MAQPGESRTVRDIVFGIGILVWYLRGDDSGAQVYRERVNSERAISSLTMMALLQGCRKAVRAFLTYKRLVPDSSG